MLSSKEASQIKPSRKLIVACQNETVRKNKDQAVYLATVGLQGCVAVVIYDQHGNASLSHVDPQTDLSFIADEIKLMDGEFKIDLIKKSGQSGDLADKIKRTLSELGLENCATTFSGSGVKKRVGESDQGTVMFNHVSLKPQVFKFQDFVEISLPNQALREDNKLKNDTLEKSEEIAEF